MIVLSNSYVDTHFPSSFEVEVNKVDSISEPEWYRHLGTIQNDNLKINDGDNKIRLGFLKKKVGIKVCKYVTGETVSQRVVTREQS